MQFDRGIFELILILVITPILFFSFKLDLNFNSNLVLEVILTMIFFTLAAFVKTYIILKIIYQYSSQSVSFLRISKSFSCSLVRFIGIYKHKKSDTLKYIWFIFEIIGIFIVLIACLIYDEVIIINKCGLNDNVSLGIISRGELEIKKINSLSDNQSLNSYDYDEKNILNDDNNENDENDDNKL